MINFIVKKIKRIPLSLIKVCDDLLFDQFIIDSNIIDNRIETLNNLGFILNEDLKIFHSDIDKEVNFPLNVLEKNEKDWDIFLESLLPEGKAVTIKEDRDTKLIRRVQKLIDEGWEVVYDSDGNFKSMYNSKFGSIDKEGILVLSDNSFENILKGKFDITTIKTMK